MSALNEMREAIELAADIMEQEIAALRAEVRRLKRGLERAHDGLKRIESGVANGWAAEDAGHQASASLDALTSTARPKSRAKKGAKR